MNLILLGIYWPVALFMAFLQYKISFSVKNIVLENTLPSNAVKAPEVLKILKNFLKKMLLSAIFFGLALSSILFIQYDSVVMGIFFLAIFGNVTALFILNIKAIEEMHELKIEKGWFTDEHNVLTNTQATKIKNRKAFPVWWFIFPLVLFIGLVIFQTRQNAPNAMIFSTALIYVLFYSLSIWMYYLVKKFPVKAVTKDTDTNIKINDVQKFFYCRLILSMLLFGLVFGFAMTFFGDGGEKANLLAFVLIIAVSLGFILYTTVLVFGFRKETNQLLAYANQIFYENEDQFWKYGLYINKNDPRIFVPSRMSMNIGVNLGHKTGQGLAIGIVVLTAAILGFLSVTLGYNDFAQQPFQLNISQENQTVQVKNFLSQRTIPIADIQAVNLVSTNKLDGAARVSGIGTQQYRTGNFRLENRQLYLLIFNRVNQAVRIETREKDIYINDRTPEKTEIMYREIQNAAE